MSIFTLEFLIYLIGIAAGALVTWLLVSERYEEKLKRQDKVIKWYQLQCYYKYPDEDAVRDADANERW